MKNFISILVINLCISLFGSCALNSCIQKKFVIVIASYNNKYWYQRNLDSVIMQNYDNYEVMYYDDASPDKTGELVENYIKERKQENKIKLIRNIERAGCPLANHYDAINKCKPTDIVVCLDGDDMFAHENVLTYLNNIYQDPNVWVTYGQFSYYPKNHVGWASQVKQEIIETNRFRDTDWVTTHLKTFYAGLFHKIKKEDLLYNDKFFPMAGDLAFMFPILEMAGNHSKFISEILYIYNNANPLNEDKVNRLFQIQMCTNIRERKKYLPVEVPYEEEDNNSARMVRPDLRQGFGGQASYLPNPDHSERAQRVEGHERYVNSAFPVRPEPVEGYERKVKNIYIKAGEGGKLFAIDDAIANRDDCLQPTYQLKQEFAKLGYNILQTDSFENLKDADFVISFDIHPNQIQYLDKYPKEKRILFLVEPPTVSSNNYNTNFHQFFGKIYTWFDDLIDNKLYFKYHYPVMNPMIKNIVGFDQKKLCTMIACNKYSSYNNELYSERLKVINFFENLNTQDFDFYGLWWNQNIFKNYKGNIANKNEILRQYKFSICFENTKNINGYVTEKIFDCFRAGCVPIYWGCANIEKYVPKNCFINKQDFKNYNELYIYLKNMKKEEYETYIKNIKDFLLSDKAKLFSIENYINLFKDLCLEKI